MQQAAETLPIIQNTEYLVDKDGISFQMHEGGDVMFTITILYDHNMLDDVFSDRFAAPNR